MISYGSEVQATIHPLHTIHSAATPPTGEFMHHPLTAPFKSIIYFAP